MAKAKLSFQDFLLQSGGGNQVPPGNAVIPLEPDMEMPAKPTDIVASIVANPNPNKPKIRSLTNPSVKFPGMVGSDMEKDAPWATRLAASFPRTMNRKVEILAKGLFPNMPIQDAVKRFGMYNDKIVFESESGKILEAEAAAPDLWDSNNMSDFVNRLKLNVENTIPAMASEGGSIAQGIAGTIGAMLGKRGKATKIGGSKIANLTKKLMPGRIPGAAIAGGGFDALRSKLSGEKVVPMSTVLAAAEEGGAETVAKLFTMFLERGLTGDFTEEALKSGKEFASEAMTRFGVHLTPAESTGLRSLVSQQRHLQNLEPSSDILTEWMKTERNPKVRDAVSRFFHQVGPKGDAFEIRESARDAAQSAIEMEKKELRVKAKPFYDQAKEIDEVDTKGLMADLDKLLGNPRLKSPQIKALNNVKSQLFRTQNRQEMVRKPKVDAQGNDILNAQGNTIFQEVEETVSKSIPDTSVEGMDRVKKMLDAQISFGDDPKNAVDADTKRLLKNFRRKLVKAANEPTKTAEVPGGTYAAGREVYEEGIPGVTALEKGATGRIANLKGDSVLKAAKYAFNSDISSPETVRNLRAAFKKAGKEEDFYGLLRSYMEEGINSIPDEAAEGTVNVGKSFYNMIYGTAKSGKRQIIDAALEGRPELKTTSDWLAKTLDALGKAMNEGSLTAYNKKGLDDLKNASLRNTAGGTGLLIPVLESLEVWKTPSKIGGYVRGILEGKYYKKLANLLISENGMDNIAELKKLSPTNEAAISGLAHLLLGQDVINSGVNAITGTPPRTKLPRSPAFDKIVKSMAPVERQRTTRGYVSQPSK